MLHYFDIPLHIVHNAMVKIARMVLEGKELYSVKHILKREPGVITTHQRGKY